MTDNTKIAAPERAPARDTGALLLAAGGLAAAFGAASCCALPLLLGSVGLGSAWLVAVACRGGLVRCASSGRTVGGRHRVSGERRRSAALASPPDRRVRARFRLRASSDHRAHDGRPVRGSGLGRTRLPLRLSEPMILESMITCPSCGTAKAEIMPTDACQFFYDCTGCGALLRPRPGDCCVFCSYGSIPCPPLQETRNCCK
jgi:hypothetical protein